MLEVSDLVRSGAISNGPVAFKEQIVCLWSTETLRSWSNLVVFQEAAVASSSITAVRDLSASPTSLMTWLRALRYRSWWNTLHLGGCSSVTISINLFKIISLDNKKVWKSAAQGEWRHLTSANREVQFAEVNIN